MGYIDSLRLLGQLEGMHLESSMFEEIGYFLELPYTVSEEGEENDKSPMVIRVVLESPDWKGDPLDIKGVKGVEVASYIHQDRNPWALKMKYLYRSPVGANVNWRYSPIERLGKPADPGKDLPGKEGRLSKIRERILNDYEACGKFIPGSVDSIMKGLNNQIDEIGTLWTDKKRSYLMVFGFEDNGVFKYPGEVPAFVNYFTEKFKTEFEKGNLAKGKTHTIEFCSACGEKSDSYISTDYVFKFSTFDKPSFLPGTYEKNAAKAYPICKSCYKYLCAGNDYCETNLKVDGIFDFPIRLHVVPELINHSDKRYFEKARTVIYEIFSSGSEQSEGLMEKLAQREEALVYHFIITEVNNAQLKVHALVEDVPPMRLRNIEACWQKAYKNAGLADDENGNVTPAYKLQLDFAFKLLVGTLMSLAGQSDNEKSVFRDLGVEYVTSILCGQPVRGANLKSIIVSRLPGLMTDSKWIKPLDKKWHGKTRLKHMLALTEFLTMMNNKGGM